jgi:hypothetical protein
MKTTITTSRTATQDRSRHWHDAIAKTYSSARLARFAMPTVFPAT